MVNANSIRWINHSEIKSLVRQRPHIFHAVHVVCDVHLLTPFQPFDFFLRDADGSLNLNGLNLSITNPVSYCLPMNSKDIGYFVNGFHFITSTIILYHFVANCQHIFIKIPRRNDGDII